jgi:hypothetical protein
MTPSLPIATDNIYKFTCLFGLALIIAGVLSFVSLYSTSLEQSVKYSEIVIQLEAKEQRNKAENDLLELNRKLLSVTGENRLAGFKFVTFFIGVGFSLSLVGAYLWYQKIQIRDDKLAKLQIEKIELEISKLRDERS